MLCIKFNYVTELRKIAAGKKSKIDFRTLARCVIEDMATPRRRVSDSQAFCERLHTLEDPRT